jgi:ComF family protein
MPITSDHIDMTDRILGFYRQALRFVLPVECSACGRSLSTDPVPFFCRDCWWRIVPFRQPSCARCDQPFVSKAATSFTPDHHCQNCQERLPAYQRAWTLFPYIPPLQAAICLFKYRGKVSLAQPLTDLMIAALPAHLDVDFVMPVPLHPSRLRTREFNQSLLLADQIARHLNRPVCPANLVRITATEPQTMLSRQARLRNLRKAFAVRNPCEIADKHLLLIDDVFTTGTTVNECAKTLKKAGAASVTILTLARTVDASLVPDHIFAEQAPSSLTALGV